MIKMGNWCGKKGKPNQCFVKKTLFLHNWPYFGIFETVLVFFERSSDQVTAMGAEAAFFQPAQISSL